MKTFAFIPLDSPKLDHFNPSRPFCWTPWEQPAPDLPQAGSEGPEVRKRKWGTAWALAPGRRRRSAWERGAWIWAEKGPNAGGWIFPSGSRLLFVGAGGHGGAAPCLLSQAGAVAVRVWARALGGRGHHALREGRPPAVWRHHVTPSF